MPRKKVDYNLIDYIPAEEIPDAYKKGLIGAYADPEMLAKLLAQSQTPLFGVAAHALIDTGKGKLSTPYKFAVKLDPEFGYYEAQTTGSCVSHGTRNVGMINYCYGILHQNKVWKGRLATEPIYGHRGHSGQGASCARLADYVVNIGGFLPRAKYTGPKNEIIDLSVFNERYGINWGRSGTPSWLSAIAKENRAESLALVTTLDEVRDAIANAYAVSCCSNFGFSSSRDSNGVSEPRGSWAHCFKAGTRIFGTRIKNIEDIKVGDKVTCHDNELHSVTKVFSREYNSKMIVIKADAIPCISVTPEHPILVSRKVNNTILTKPTQFPTDSNLQVKIKKYKQAIEELLWIEAKDVVIGDKIVCVNSLPSYNNVDIPQFEYSKRCRNIPKQIITQSDELAWLFGLYIGDGNSVKNHKIVITLGLTEENIANKAKDIIEKYFGITTYIYRKSNCLRVTAYSSVLAKAFKKWFGGGKGINDVDKHIPEFLFAGWNIRELINGLIDSDGGFYEAKKQFYITNSSVELIYQVYYILLALHECPCLEKNIKGKGAFANSKDTYTLRWYNTQIRHKHQGYFYFSTVHKIEEENYTGTVYNLEVEGRNSYIANGMLVHNCMAWVGYDDSEWAYKNYKGPLILVQNSWGKWNSGGIRESQPLGSFWIRGSVAQRMLNARGSFVISNVKGFPGRKLDYNLI